MEQSTTAPRPLFHRNFTLLIVGQIISLFGNAVLRFTLSLYVLDATGSAAVFGGILAFSTVPTVLLTPLGGVLADRVPRQRIMVALDFATSALVLCYARFDFPGGGIALLGGVITALSVIQALYQPSVQASVPALTAPERLLAANGAVAQVQALSALLGPILGGFLYGFFGAEPVLLVSGGCFFLSAVLELFLRIPFSRLARTGGALRQIAGDLGEALRFLRRERPALLRMLLAAAGLNLALSSLFLVGLPFLVKEHLGLSSQLYGFVEASMGVGTILGGLLAGLLGRRLRIGRSTALLGLSAVSLLPLVPALLSGAAPLVVYAVAVGCVLFGMTCNALFSILAMTFLQQSTPERLLGKIAAFTTTLCTCAMPLGQALYGWLLEALRSQLWAVFLLACLLTLAIVLASRGTVRALSAEPAEA